LTTAMVEIYEKLEVQIGDLYKEMSILSKKSPDGKTNKFKLNFVNQLLSTSNELLSGNFVPLVGFEKFDEDDAPSNSDVVLVISQYISCLQKYKFDNIKWINHEWRWVVDDAEPIMTTPPEYKFTR